MGGRHPGYYFKTETSDLVKSDIICPKTNNNESISIGRGGAVAELVSPDIVLCGGRDRMNEVMDTCSKYNIKDHMWDDHSQLLVPREEAASAVLAGQMYILGGLVDGEHVRNSEKHSGDEWTDGPNLPEGRARFCAVALDDSSIAILGGEVPGNDGITISSEIKTYNVDNGEWTIQPDMLVRRKDHACALVQIDNERGILVSGGVDNEDNLLDSVEFYNLATQAWEEISALKNGRTEHGESHHR